MSFCIMPFLLCLRSISSYGVKIEGLKKSGTKTSIKKLSLELTIEELEVLLPLASDQLFRNEFIDIRIPGFERNREKIQSAKAVISRIKERLHLAQHESSATVRFSIRY
jgi:hypothetical protein